MSNFSIVVAIFNQYKFVKLCLESLERNNLKNEIILIDDCSSEKETIDLIENYSLKNNWKIFRNEKSLGHSGASELGIKKSEFENVFLLNSDTIVTNNSLQILHEVLENNKDIAVVGPYTSSAFGKQQIQEFYNKRFELSIEQIEKIANDISFNYSFFEIPLVNGFCMGLKKSIYEEIGGFDPALTCYGNEQELLIRIKNKGYKTVLVCNSYVHHFGKISYGKTNINIGKAVVDASRYIMKKHGKLE